MPSLPSDVPVSLSVSVVSQQRQALAPILTTGRRSIFSNWANTVSCRPLGIFRPRTVEEVKQVLQYVRLSGGQVTVVGRGHSPGDLPCTEGWMMELLGLNQFLRVEDGNVACVQGGMVLSSFHPQAAKHGLALSSLGSISDQTIAGAIATATHGAGVTYGNLSSVVRWLDVVLPIEGEPVKRCSKEENQELFYASLCGLGLTGVIVALGIECEPLFDLKEEVQSIEFEDFVERIDEVAESAQHVRCFWYPQVGEVVVSRLNRTKEPRTPKPNFFKAWIFDSFLAVHLNKIGYAIGRYFPRWLPYHANFIYAFALRPGPISTSKWWTSGFWRVHALQARAPAVTTKEKGGPIPYLTESVVTVDSSVAVFNYDCDVFRQYTIESCIPSVNLGAFLKEFKEWYNVQLADPKGLKGHFPIEVRWTEQDDVWLSPTYKQRGCYVGLIAFKPFNLPVSHRLLFQHFSRLSKAHDGRPHWAKAHSYSSTELRALFPRFDDFLRVRKEADPQGVLLNPYARRHLLGEVGEEVDTRRFRSGRW